MPTNIYIYNFSINWRQCHRWRVHDVSASQQKITAVLLNLQSHSHGLVLKCELRYTKLTRNWLSTIQSADADESSKFWV